MRVRVGVIGLGFMGSAHARLYRGMDGCELVGLCDQKENRKSIAESWGCDFFLNYEDLLKKVDAVSICTPTSTHSEIALRAIEEGVHLLVEKPLASSVAEGEQIVREAEKHSVLMGVGYVERFNPAVQKLSKIVDLQRIYSTVSLRFGPLPPSVKDSGVLLDLGTHEIDMLNHLTNALPKILHVHLSNDGIASRFEDYAFLSLAYGRIHSHIEVSWRPTYKLRVTNLYSDDGFYSLDYAQQVLRAFRAPPKIRLENGSWRDALWLSRNVEDLLPITVAEPLELELSCFRNSVAEGKILGPLCTGEEALSVLKTVEEALSISHKLTMDKESIMSFFPR